jgi:GDP-4-dehydro-6-deoxy-D-mannose reductase
MKKYIITGFSGFVGKHFLDFLGRSEFESMVLGLDLNEPEFDYKSYRNVRCNFQKINLLEDIVVKDIIKDFLPEYILHLASFSSVFNSWKTPIESFNNNVNIFLSLLETLRELQVFPRILSIGSSEEYGYINEVELPLVENNSLNPVSPYAVARVAQELMSKVYVNGFGMDIILTRSFNHFGPGQREDFAISSFAKHLVQEKLRGAEKCQLATGDIIIVRDFLDVRDVVKAYYLLLENGKKGEVYNVCSGQGVSLKDIIIKMATKLNIKVDIVINNNLLRPNDNPIIIGSNNKIRRELGWYLQYDLNQSLDDILNYWELRLR